MSAFGQALDPVGAAHDLFEERRYAEAIEAYQTLLEEGVPTGDGTHVPLRETQRHSIRLMLGQCYGQMDEVAAAQRVFQEIIDEVPDDPYAGQAMHRLGNLYWERYRFKEAIRLCKQIRNQHMDTQAGAVAGYLVGNYQREDGQFQEALESYQYFLEHFSDSLYRGSVISAMIYLYRESGDYAAAEKLLRDRMREHPEDTTLVEQLGDLYEKQGASSKAIEFYRQVLESDPGNTSLRQKLADLYVEIGQRDQAANEWEKIVGSEASQADQKERLGSIYLSHKMYPEAIEAYREAVRLRPQNAYLYTQLAAVYKIRGQVEEAASVYTEGLERLGFTGNQRLVFWRPMLEIYEDPQFEPLREKLIQRFVQKRAEAPKIPNIALTLGELFFYAGRVSEALETFLSLHRGFPLQIDMVLERYAQVLERKGDPQAVDFYEALIANSKDRMRIRTARSKLAVLYEKMGRWNEAVAVLEALVRNREASVKNKLLLGRLQLQGLRSPEAAARTFQSLQTGHIVEARLGLAECHILRQEYDLAREILEPIAARPNNLRGVATKLIGDSHFFAAEFDEAVASYKAVIQHAKSDQLTNDALERIVLIQNHTDYLKIPLTDYADALHLYLNGETAAALRTCERSLETYPQSTLVDAFRFLVGDIHNELGDAAAALEAYQQVAAAESLMAPRALVKIAEIYRRDSDLESAAATYTTLLMAYPENVIVVHARQKLDEIMKLQGKR